MSAPTPTLEYGWLRRSGDGVRGDQSLYNVHDVTARLDEGRLRVVARGRMLRKDGLPGPNRCCTLYEGGQPEWLSEIVEDARHRLVAPHIASRDGSDG